MGLEVVHLEWVSAAQCPMNSPYISRDPVSHHFPFLFSPWMFQFAENVSPPVSISVHNSTRVHTCMCQYHGMWMTPSASVNVPVTQVALGHVHVIGRSTPWGYVCPVVCTIYVLLLSGDISLPNSSKHVSTSLFIKSHNPSRVL